MIFSIFLLSFSYTQDTFAQNNGNGNANAGWQPAVESLQQQVDSFFDIFVEIVELNQEILDRQAGDAGLQAQIDSFFDVFIEDAELESERQARIAADDALQTKTTNNMMSIAGNTDDIEIIETEIIALELRGTNPQTGNAPDSFFDVFTEITVHDQDIGEIQTELVALDLRGQTCPQGEVVVGIDSIGDIICEPLENVLPAPDCSVQNDCNGNGMCVSDNMCQCDAGFGGDDCSILDTGMCIVDSDCAPEQNASSICTAQECVYFCNAGFSDANFNLGAGIDGCEFNEIPLPFDLDDFSVNEDQGNIILALAWDPNDPAFDGLLTVDFDYSTSDGTATAPDDYTATSASKSVPVEDGLTTFAIGPIIDDTDIEPTETLTLTLTDPNAGGAVIDTITISIINYDDLNLDEFPPELVAEAEFQCGPFDPTGPNWDDSDFDCWLSVLLEIDTVTYAGLAFDAARNQAIPSVWAFNGFLGIQAGDQMCKSLGADHVCSYEELLLADSKGELDNLFDELDGDKSIWLTRLNPVIVDGDTYTPGAGARCNDWTLPGNALADGEFATVSSDGTINYTFDSNACYTGDAADGCYSGNSDLQCGGKERNIPCCFAMP